MSPDLTGGQIISFFITLFLVYFIRNLLPAIISDNNVQIKMKKIKEISKKKEGIYENKENRRKTDFFR